MKQGRMTHTYTLTFSSRPLLSLLGCTIHLVFLLSCPNRTEVSCLIEFRYCGVTDIEGKEKEMLDYLSICPCTGFLCSCVSCIYTMHLCSGLPLCCTPRSVGAHVVDVPYAIPHMSDAQYLGAYSRS
ncbi:uncharacterized protein BDV17DRAFT_264997 [Aspergillus undulatus]|uniref:uncharacterized protein n=1 Tax=Aspergillus undulatus TaxID=1810928 RepID=UPI003CCDCAEB